MSLFHFDFRYFVPLKHFFGNVDLAYIRKKNNKTRAIRDRRLLRAGLVPFWLKKG